MKGFTLPERMCQRPGCDRPIPPRKRSDARWCSRSCESKASRAARRKAAFEAAYPGTAELLRKESQTLAELHAAATPPAESGPDDPGEYDDDGDLTDYDDDDTAGPDDDGRRAETARRISAETRKTWRAYGRRHGTEHPGQRADRLQRHETAEKASRAAIEANYTAGPQTRFDSRTAGNIGAAGRASRGLNKYRAEQPPFWPAGD